jgi:hypothetical protein
VPSYDFEVDLQGLVKAAQGMSDTVQLFKDKDVEDLVPTEESLGHEAVWSAVAEFKDRWERGMNNLVEDVEEMSGRLSKVAMNYADFDEQGASTLSRAATQAREVRVAPQ